MNCHVTLNGPALSWQFAGSAALQTWLDSRPWQGRGDVAGIRVPGADCADRIVHALKGAIYAADQGASKLLQVVELSPAVAHENLLSTILDHLGFECGGTDDSVSNRRDLHRLTEVLADQTFVFVAVPGPTPDRLWRQGQKLIDDLRRGEVYAPLTLVSIAAGGPPDAEDRVFDFRVGAPTTELTSFLDAGMGRLWGAYVHHRLAWECGGDLGRVYRWKEQLPDDLPAERDDLLEDALTACSRRDVEELTRTQIEAIHELLESRTGGADTGGSVAVSELEACGAVWRPTDAHGQRITPWLARGLLAQDRETAARWYLRSALVCAPLAREILGRCLDLEAEVRVQLSREGTLARSCPPEEAAERFTQLKQGSFRCFYYPEGHPAPPTVPGDEWVFASLGQFLNATRHGLRDSSLRRAVATLRDLRNALAHGHHACWKHVTDLRDITRVSAASFGA